MFIDFWPFICMGDRLLSISSLNVYVVFGWMGLLEDEVGFFLSDFWPFICM